MAPNRRESESMPIPMTSVPSRPLQHLEVPVYRGTSTSNLSPITPIRSRPLQNIKLPFSRSLTTGIYPIYRDAVVVVESEVWGAAESGSGWDADLIIVVVVVVVVFLVVVVVRREAFSRVPALGRSLLDV